MTIPIVMIVIVKYQIQLMEQIYVIKQMGTANVNKISLEGTAVHVQLDILTTQIVNLVYVIRATQKKAFVTRIMELVIV